MPCALTKGRGLDCKDSVGGIKKVYFAELENITLTEASGSVSDLGTVSLYGYTLPRNGGTATENIQANPENGTTFYEQVVELNLNKQSVEDRNEILLLAKNRLAIITEDNEGVFKLYGSTRGADITAGTAASGTNKGDRNGYTLTFTAEEPELGKYFDSDPTQFVDVTVVDA